MTMPPSKARILIVDDDYQVVISLRRALSLRGFEVEGVESTGEAVPYVESKWPDAIVLDVRMPGMDGISFCRLIRDRLPVPIIMLTARDAVEDRVAGLDAGADDYLVKPFAVDELAARLRALLRRVLRNPLPESDSLSYQDIVLHRRGVTVSRGQEKLPLTLTEFRLLEKLMSEPGRVFSRAELLEAIWGYETPTESNTVDVHITNLRKKLEAGGKPRIVQTVRRAGFTLRDG